jgi:hypothetical protein
MIDAIFFDSDSDPVGTPCLDLILAGQIPNTPISGLLTVRSNNPQNGNDNSAGTVVMDKDHIYLRYFLDTSSSSVIQRCTFDAGAQTFLTEMVDGIDQEGFSEYNGEHCLITRKALLQEGFQNHSIYATGADPDATVFYSFGGQKAILPRNLLIDLAVVFLADNPSAMIPKDFLTELPAASLVGGQTVIIPRNFLIDLPASAGGQTVIIPRNFLIDLPASAGGQTVIIPRNFLIDLPANRLQ